MWGLVDDLNFSKWGCSLSQWNSALDEHTILKIPPCHLFYTLWVIALSAYNSSIVGLSYIIFFLSKGTLYSQERASYNSNIFFSTQFSKYHSVTCFVLDELLLCQHTPHQWLDPSITFFLSRDTLYTQEKTSYNSNIFWIYAYIGP
jgi:hypothetical protein